MHTPERRSREHLKDAENTATGAEGSSMDRRQGRKPRRETELSSPRDQSWGSGRGSLAGVWGDAKGC